MGFNDSNYPKQKQLGTNKCEANQNQGYKRPKHLILGRQNFLLLFLYGNDILQGILQLRYKLAMPWHGWSDPSEIY